MRPADGSAGAGRRFALGSGLVLPGLLVLLAGAGCSVLGDDEYPDRSCRDSNDCFTAQGETCDLETRTCVGSDGGTASPSDEPDTAASTPTSPPAAAPAGGERAPRGERAQP